MAGAVERDVRVQAGNVGLDGNLSVPAGSEGLVIFAHGGGSSRFSTRSRQVAEWLQEGRLATLLFDLLTAEEHNIDERTRQYRFDIHLSPS